ncbi:GGDEF domain-containing response regulator [Chrysiogenes arsenatis]|uniref:GGDEF domain-containing response regulator n=1 Tax=Chrysiogenes arsenatis TaxID=309797 RepID=UPI0004146050|nr:diguanylate cyclase [Chrysiogenes arsenatis]
MQPTRILVVEDEGVVALDIERTLRRLGYEVCGSCPSAEEALESITPLMPDIILMDIMLRGEMDGINAADIIRHRHGLPVVFLTSHADRPTLERAKVTKPFGYILKPFDDRELHSNIEMALHSHRIEKKLEESAELFRAVSENAVAAVFIICEDQIIYANDAFLKIIDYDAAELATLRFSELLPAESRDIAELIQCCQLAPNRYQRTIQLIAKSGTPRWVELATNSIMLQNRCSAIATALDVSLLKELQEKLEISASTDMLTGSFNRRKLDESFAQEKHRSFRYQVPFCLAIFDIDHFKQVNDTHGHSVGDDVLRTLAALVAKSLRPNDSLFRWGGEEFAILTSGIEGDSAYHMAERLRQIIANFTFESIGRLTVSFGIAESCEADTLDSLFLRADAALYQSKVQGRNRVTLAPKPTPHEPS